MANSLYTLAKQRFLNCTGTVGTTSGASIDWLNDNIKVALLSSAYTPNLATHQFLTDTTGTVATSANLASKAVTNGVATAAATLTFTAVSGSQVFYILGYKDTGTAGTSPLIFLDDTATGLPVTPNGGNITITWDTGPNGIFAL